MFVEAIEKAAQFTRAIHSIIRTYGGKKIIPGAGTLFFVNDEGFAVTCKHVAEILISADKLNKQYFNFKADRNKLRADNSYKQNLKGLELKYNYNPASIIQVKNNFVDCVDRISGFTAHLHPKYDLAILKFNDYGMLRYQKAAVFLKDSSCIRQGEFLCRLGFPFPEFSNYSFNEATDDIEWSGEGITASPRFPIEGMVTRFLGDESKVYGVELSTPGLKGQSGGPLFNKDGIVYGMQFSTKHLHLGFDIVDKEIISNNQAKKVSDYSFLHLGQCIHVEVIKEFLREKSVKYDEV